MINPHGARRPRLRLRAVVVSAAVCSIFFWFLLFGQENKRRPVFTDDEIRQKYPLAWKHVYSAETRGGAWYIPPDWIGPHDSQPQTILEAAKLAAKAAAAEPDRHMPLSNIPLIVHQTWKTSRLNGSKSSLVPFVNQWLVGAIDPPRGGEPMAYFFWDDLGVMDLMQHYEAEIVDKYLSAYSMVERGDIFRVLVCKWFGGIYADIDTTPLKHPSKWIRDRDVERWTDKETGKEYGLESAARSIGNRPRPVNITWGIECDTDPASDSYWRWEYMYPVQLTNWALASAAHHPILQRFTERLAEQTGDGKVATTEKTSSGGLTRVHYDPIVRTGPAAVTELTSAWLSETAGLRWNAVTGLHDGGRAKLIEDVLILPITGFAPTEPSRSRMGEKPPSDPDARLAHMAMGSWRHTNMVVEYGKFCRTFFGFCKDWQKPW